MGFGKVYPMVGLSYSRKVDSRVLSALSGLGQSAHKIGLELRVMEKDGETKSLSGGLCPLSKYLVNECHNVESEDFMRDVSVPNAFLAADAVLKLLGDASGLNVCRSVTVER